MRTEEDLRTELEAAGPGDTPPVPDLDTLIGRGRRARFRRRLVVSTAGVAVIAVAAAPAIWLTTRGPAVENTPVLGAPAPIPSAATAPVTKPKPQPVGSAACSVYWVCKNPGDKPVTKPVAGEIVPVGATVDGSPIVLFATRGAVDGAGRPGDLYVYAGYTDPAGRPVAANSILGTDPVTAQLEPIPMYRTDADGRWAIAGQLKGTASSVTAILADGRRVNVPHRSTAVADGYTHFWLAGRNPAPVRFEAVTPAGTVKCKVVDCSSIG
jgi:hypothetical protein